MEKIIAYSENEWLSSDKGKVEEMTSPSVSWLQPFMEAGPVRNFPLKHSYVHE